MSIEATDFWFLEFVARDVLSNLGGRGSDPRALADMGYVTTEADFREVADSALEFRDAHRDSNYAAAKAAGAIACNACSHGTGKNRYVKYVYPGTHCPHIQVSMDGKPARFVIEN